MLVLVVDDDPVQTRTIRRNLELDGHVVFEAHTGLQAADLVLKHEIKIAIIDWMLPGSLNGIQLGRMMRRRGMATFLMSGHTVAEIREEWKDPLEGFLQFFAKPLEITRLRREVLRVEKSLEDTEP